MIRPTNRRFRLAPVSLAMALLAVMAVAIVQFPSGNHLAHAQSTCPYTQTPGGLSDLGFKHQQVTTWQMGKTNSFTFGGPYVGRVSVDSSTGIEVSTNQNFTCGSGAQSITIQKSAGPTEIHVQRCDADQTHIEFTTVLVDGCSGQATSVYTWEWLEPTDAPIEVRRRDNQLPYHYASATPATTTNGTCNIPSQNSAPSSTSAPAPQGDIPIRGRWTGPNISSIREISDAMKIRREARQLILKVRDGEATPGEAQETADTLWLMSHEARNLPIFYTYEKTGGSKKLWEILRHWVTDEGLEPSEEARTAGVPWAVFYNRYGETFTPAQARERYGGAPDGNISLWRQRNPVAWYQEDPGGLEEVMVGPPKDHGEPKPGAWYTDSDGTILTQREAVVKYGTQYQAGLTTEEWEAANGLTRVPEWIHPDDPEPAQQENKQTEEEPAPVCNTSNSQTGTASDMFLLDDGTLCINGVPRSALDNPSPEIAQLTADAEAIYAPAAAAYIDWHRQWQQWINQGRQPPERGEEIFEIARSIENERRSIEYKYLKDQIRLLAAEPRCLCQPTQGADGQPGECRSLPRHMLPTRTDVDDLGVTYAGYEGAEPVSHELADLMVKLAVGMRAERIWRAGYPTRYAADIEVRVQQTDGTTSEMSLAEYLGLDTGQADTEPPEESAGEIPTGPITIEIATNTETLPLEVGQPIYYRDAVHMGDPLMAGMVVANIETDTSPTDGHVIRTVTLHGTGGAPPPSARPANAPTELTQIMRLPGPPELSPGTVITPAMSIMIADDYRYMDMTVQTVVPTADGLVKIVWLSPPNP